MSTLTKILVVLLTVSVIALCPVVATYVATANNYKELYENQKKDINTYDLIFLGFPIVNGPHSKAVEFLKTKLKGKKVALFITHGAPMDAPHLKKWLAKAKLAAKNAKLIGLFNCRGRLFFLVNWMMRLMPDPKMKKWAKEDDSHGHPNKQEFIRARQFARDMLKKAK